jgi:oligoribonuclease (3'-5' exoribonuclease)
MYIWISLEMTGSAINPAASDRIVAVWGIVMNEADRWLADTAAA